MLNRSLMRPHRKPIKLQVTFVPILIVDVLGSILMIVLSIACLRMVRRLKQDDQENVIWTYLLWFCYGLTAFSFSRSCSGSAFFPNGLFANYFAFLTISCSSRRLGLIRILF